VDAQTTSLLDALAHPGAALVLALCEGEATEADLLSAVGATSQATANRRLGELERLGLVERDSGKAKAPGRVWRLVEPAPTEALLRAALDLADILATSEQRRRQAAKRRLKRAHAARVGMRRVDDLG